MESLRKGTLVLLMISLAVNVILLFKVNQLEKRMPNLRQHTHQLETELRSIHSELRSYNQRLSRMEEDQAWVQHREFIPVPEKSSPEHIVLRLQWSFREIENDANVQLLYRETGGEWTAVQGEWLGGTTYQAELAVDPESHYEYQIMAEGSLMRRSGEMTRIPASIYQPATPLTSFGSSSQRGVLNSVNVSVQYSTPPMFDFYEIRQAKLVIYEEHAMVLEKELEREQGHHPDVPEEKLGWHTRVDLVETQPTEIYLVIEYVSGKMEELLMWYADKETGGQVSVDREVNRAGSGSSRDGSM